MLRHAPVRRGKHERNGRDFATAGRTGSSLNACLFSAPCPPHWCLVDSMELRKFTDSPSLGDGGDSPHRGRVLRCSGQAVDEYGSVRRESLRLLRLTAPGLLLRGPEARLAIASLEFPNRDCEGARATAAPRHPKRAKLRSRHPRSRESALVRAPLATRLGRSPREALDLGRGPRQTHARAACLSNEATIRCQEEPSPERDQRQLPFHHRFRREPQRFRNVLPLQVRMQIDNVVCGHALGHQLHHHRDRNAQSANTRSAAHLIGTDRDARKIHQARVAPRNETSALAPQVLVDPRPSVVPPTACRGGARSGEKADTRLAKDRQRRSMDRLEHIGSIVARPVRREA